MPGEPPVRHLKYRRRRLRMRTLDERLAMRLPRLLNGIAARVTRLPLSSRARRFLVARRTCQGFQAVARGDLDLLLAVYHEDVVTTFGAIEGWPPDLVGEHHGRDAFRAMWEAWNSTWEDLRVEPRELIDTGERLVVTVEMTGTGKGSGIPYSVRYFDVYTLRDGRISRHDMFRDRSEALAAAGLQPVV